MPAKDKFHDVVKAALVKDGWTITDDPFKLTFGEKSFFVDLGAEKLFAAEKDNRKIAVEVKSFLSVSQTYEFHLAVGQFINYRIFLDHSEPGRVLYLAVMLDVYEEFLERQKFVQVSLTVNRIKLIVCDIKKGEVVRWLE